MFTIFNRTYPTIMNIDEFNAKIEDLLYESGGSLYVLMQPLYDYEKEKDISIEYAFIEQCCLYGYSDLRIEWDNDWNEGHKRVAVFCIANYDYLKKMFMKEINHTYAELLEKSEKGGVII